MQIKWHVSSQKIHFETYLTHILVKNGFFNSPFFLCGDISFLSEFYVHHDTLADKDVYQSMRLSLFKELSINF